MVRYHFRDRYHSAQEILTNLEIAKNRIINGLGEDTTGIVDSRKGKVARTEVVRQSQKKQSNSTAKVKTNKSIPLIISILILLLGAVIGGNYLLNNDFRLPINLQQAE